MGSLIESQGDSPNVENKCLVLADECNSSNSGAQRKRPKTGSGRSNVWDYFVKIGVGGDGKQKCKCKSCGKVYTCGYVGTSHLHYHITKCPVITKSRIQNAAEKLEVRRLDQRVVRELTTQMIIQHELPFQFVELEGFRAFTKYVSSDRAQFVSRDAVTADVLKVYSLEKDKLKKQLAAISGRVCLTFRCWTSSCSSQGYVALTAQYMDEDWKLNVKLLNFCHLDPPHDNFELSNKVLDYLKEWGIERKIFSITVDNASTNEDLRNLKQRLCLHNSLLSNGDYFHFKCCARVLNLMVGESLVVVSDVVHKIWESVKYVAASSSRLKQFYQCVEEVGGVHGVDGLYLDVSSSGKWNSIYLMLNSAIEHRRAFERMRSKDMMYKHCPSSEEWDRGDRICGFLKIFYELADMASGSTYPTPITHSWQIWRIEFSLRRMKLSEDHKIRDMASKMLDEFDKYLSEYSMILAFGVVLSPRMKLDHLEFSYYRLADKDLNIARDRVNNVRKALSALFNEYANKGATTSSSLSAIDTCFSPSTLEEKPKLSPLAEYCVSFCFVKPFFGSFYLNIYLIFVFDLNIIGIS